MNHQFQKKKIGSFKSYRRSRQDNEFPLVIVKSSSKKLKSFKSAKPKIVKNSNFLSNPRMNNLPRLNSQRQRVSFNNLHKTTNQPISLKMVFPKIKTQKEKRFAKYRHLIDYNLSESKFLSKYGKDPKKKKNSDDGDDDGDGENDLKDSFFITGTKY